eukprot:scaffold7916_cov31-Tisochrysis_lutea.AAC.1
MKGGRGGDGEREVKGDVGSKEQRAPPRRRPFSAQGSNLDNAQSHDADAGVRRLMGNGDTPRSCHGSKILAEEPRRTFFADLSCEYSCTRASDCLATRSKYSYG